MTGLPARQAGVASALATTSRQLGNTLGVAVLASVAAGARFDQRRAWLVALGLGLAVALINAVAGRPRPAAPDQPATTGVPERERAVTR